MSTDNQNLFDIFFERFPEDLTQTLLFMPSGETYSYADALDESGRMARCLSDMGLRAGDRVTVQVEKSPEAVWLYLACLRGGFVFHPLNMDYQLDELVFFVNNAKPAAVVCDPVKRDLFEELTNDSECSILTLDASGGGTLSDAIVEMPAPFRTRELGANDLAVLLYSSGTTGVPKGAKISHGNLAANTLTLVDSWGFTPDDVLLHALPIYHAHGLFVAVGCVLMSGSSMLFIRKFNTDEVVAGLPDCSVMMGVPTFYTRLLADERFDSDLTQHMRLFISGSAPLLPETFTAFEERTGQRILERYGMTETSMNASNPLEGERRPGSVGPALPGIELRVVGDDDRELPRGEIGHLQVRGPNVFSGYWKVGRDNGKGKGKGKSKNKATGNDSNTNKDAGTRQRLHQRRFFPHRRPRADRNRRLRQHCRSFKGHDHYRRTERVPPGGRINAGRTADGDGISGGRCAAPGLRGRRYCRGGAAGRIPAARRRPDRGFARPHGRLQAPETGLHGRCTAPQPDGQSAEKPAAGNLRRHIHPERRPRRARGLSIMTAYAHRPRRSVLYMPGSNQRAMDKARQLDADAVIFDLEDAVAPEAKAEARKMACAAVEAGGYGDREVAVRVNGADTPWWDDDLRAVAGCGANAVVLPKVESPGTVAGALRILDVASAPAEMQVWIMTETPAGVLNLSDIITGESRLGAIIMGTSDLARDLRVSPLGQRPGLLHSLGQCILVARAAGIDIIDGVHLALDDDRGLPGSPASRAANWASTANH